MTSDRTRTGLEGAGVSVTVKLSALWATAMFLYLYVDVFAFYKPGTVEDILIGRVWEFEITQAWALGGLVLMTLPSLMVFLSVALPAATARWANIVVASLFVVVSIGNSIGETWAFIWFGSAVEVALLVLVIRLAWRWPRADTRLP